MLAIPQPLFSFIDLTLNLDIPWTKTPLAFYWHVWWNGSTQLGNNFIFPLCNSIIRLKGTYRFFCRKPRAFRLTLLVDFCIPSVAKGQLLLRGRNARTETKKGKKYIPDHLVKKKREAV